MDSEKNRLSTDPSKPYRARTRPRKGSRGRLDRIFADRIKTEVKHVHLRGRTVEGNRGKFENCGCWSPLPISHQRINSFSAKLHNSTYTTTPSLVVENLIAATTVLQFTLCWTAFNFFHYCLCHKKSWRIAELDHAGVAGISVFIWTLPASQSFSPRKVSAGHRTNDMSSC